MGSAQGHRLVWSQALRLDMSGEGPLGGLGPGVLAEGATCSAGV